MNLLLQLALLGWIPLTLLMFVWVGPSRAAIGSLVWGYLFLPQAEAYGLSKYAVITLGVLVAAALIDVRRLTSLRPRLFDLPMAAFCLAPMASSLANDLGTYDGAVGVKEALLVYGGPYMVGRAYLRGPADVQRLLRTIAIGGLLYVPLCWLEIRLSPQLHTFVYGFHQHQFTQSIRLGGWRPTVFLQHGLAVGAWMAASTVAAFGLWRARQPWPRLRLPPGLAVSAMLLTTVFVKSVGSIALMLVGIATLLLSSRGRWRGVLVVLAIAPSAYLVARIGIGWRGEALTTAAESVDEDRAGSLAVRLESDAQLVDRAMERPLFGWGGWGRFRGGLAATDSFWSIILGTNGLLGLGGIFGAMLVAQLNCIRRLRTLAPPPRSIEEVVIATVLVAIYALDCLANSMICPVYLALVGGLVGWGTSPDPRPASGRTPLPASMANPG